MNDIDVTQAVLGVIVTLIAIVGFFSKMRADVEASFAKREEALWKRIETALHDVRDSVNEKVGKIDAHQILSQSRWDRGLDEIKQELAAVRKDSALAAVLEERLDGHIELTKSRLDGISDTLRRLDGALPHAMDYMEAIRSFIKEKGV